MALTTIPQSLLSGNLPKNYLSLSNANSDMESGSVLPWTTFSTTLSNGVPTTVTTGGTGSITIATNSTSPLTGNFDLLMTKPASNVVGTGFISGVLTIDREDLAKMLFGQLSYYSTSANIDASGTSTQSLEIWIYNVVGNYWIQPSGYRGMNTNGSPGKVTYNFQTDSLAANNQYRIAIFTAQTSALAYTIEFDSFALGPQTISNVSIRGPVGSIIATGSVTPTTGYLYANGSAISRTQYSALFAAIGVLYGAGDGSTTFNIPNLQGVFARGAGSQTIGGIVSSATLGTTQGDQAQSHQHNSNTETTFRASPGSGLLVPFSGNASTYVAGQISNPVTDGTNGAPRYGAETRPANVSVAYHICFDAGNTQLSSDSDQRTVAFKKSNINNSFAYTSGVSGDLTWITAAGADIDTHGGWNGTYYTIPVSGYYDISACFALNSSAYTAGTQIDLFWSDFANTVIIDNAEFTSGSSTARISGGKFNGNFYYNAGQIIKPRFYQGIGAVSFQNLSISIKRLSGSAVVQATESVNASYVATGAPAVAAGGNIKYDSRLKDTHAAYNTTSGIYTVPVSGEYRLSIIAAFSAVSSAYIIRNGAGFGYLATAQLAGYIFSASRAIPLIAGDTISIAIDAAASLSAPAAQGAFNSFSIERVGN